jgi:hypothetical protein
MRVLTELKKRLINRILDSELNHPPGLRQAPMSAGKPLEGCESAGQCHFTPILQGARRPSQLPERKELSEPKDKKSSGKSDEPRTPPPNEILAKPPGELR